MFVLTDIMIYLQQSESMRNPAMGDDVRFKMFTDSITNVVNKDT